VWCGVRGGAQLLEIVVRNYIAVADFFRRHIEDNDLFKEELQDQRRQLTEEYDKIAELYRSNSEFDSESYLMEKWTLEAVEDFNDKSHIFIRKILDYANLQTDLLHQQGVNLRRRLDEGI
jgi:hypothetical protein